MALKSFEELRRDLKNKIYYPVYLLQGEEPYYIDQLSHLIETGVLDEMEECVSVLHIFNPDSECIESRFDMTSTSSPYTANSSLFQ